MLRETLDVLSHLFRINKTINLPDQEHDEVFKKGLWKTTTAIGRKLVSATKDSKGKPGAMRFLWMANGFDTILANARERIQARKLREEEKQRAEQRAKEGADLEQEVSQEEVERSKEQVWTSQGRSLFREMTRAYSEIWGTFGAFLVALAIEGFTLMFSLVHTASTTLRIGMRGLAVILAMGSIWGMSASHYSSGITSYRADQITERSIAALEAAIHWKQV